MATADRVLTVLEHVAETDQVRKNLDIDLFGLDILDSFGMVTLMVALSEEFAVDIAPAEVERQQWATPRRIVGYMEERVGP
jgi:D-alanine--poly(phosphoribitol) ligase subunit 2